MLAAEALVRRVVPEEVAVSQFLEEAEVVPELVKAPFPHTQLEELAATHALPNLIHQQVVQVLGLAHLLAEVVH